MIVLLLVYYCFFFPNLFYIWSQFSAVLAVPQGKLKYHYAGILGLFWNIFVIEYRKIVVISPLAYKSPWLLETKISGL